MGTYDHLPKEQRHLAHDIDTIMGPILRGLTGTPNTPPRHTETIPRHYRIVVATDWHAATVPYLILHAFTRIVPPQAPIDLVFTLPHTPTRRDHTAARLLLQSLAPNTPHAGILIESFDTTATNGTGAPNATQGEPCRAPSTATPKSTSLATAASSAPHSGATSTTKDSPTSSAPPPPN
ncbi:hypothetical protein [Dermatophilus congolensis]|uniref:hypothetical protein n=1 Tax=Dermatophilus congolensis TaxID=1863 RepID=UPI00312C8E84